MLRLSSAAIMRGRRRRFGRWGVASWPATVSGFDAFAEVRGPCVIDRCEVTVVRRLDGVVGSYCSDHVIDLEGPVSFDGPRGVLHVHLATDTPQLQGA